MTPLLIPPPQTPDSFLFPVHWWFLVCFGFGHVFHFWVSVLLIRTACLFTHTPPHTFLPLRPHPRTVPGQCDLQVTPQHGGMHVSGSLVIVITGCCSSFPGWKKNAFPPDVAPLPCTLLPATATLYLLCCHYACFYILLFLPSHLPRLPLLPPTTLFLFCHTHCLFALACSVSSLTSMSSALFLLLSPLFTCLCTFSVWLGQEVGGWLVGCGWVGGVGRCSLYVSWHSICSIYCSNLVATTLALHFLLSCHDIHVFTFSCRTCCV